FRSGRYGKAALEELAARTGGPGAAVIAERAGKAMRLERPWQQAATATRESRAANITVVHPPGQALPESFARHEWTTETASGAQCLTNADAVCQAVLIDLDADGTMEVLLFQSTSPSRRTGNLNARAFMA